MELKPLPYRSGLDRYQAQADGLLGAYRARDAEAVAVFKRHPRFLDAKIKWLSTNPSDEEVLTAGLGLDDARLAIARLHDFRDWPALLEYVQAVTREGSPVARYEAAVEAVIAGDVATLSSMLRDDPGLVRARSTRVTHFDPPVHRSTLLHYVAANGVEGYRQKTPKNAVEVARLLLDSGAEVDALADLYGQGCTTMSLLVSSCHPAEAGLQVPLANLLLDYGASIEGDDSGRWSSPLMTALAFGYTRTAEALAKRGARTDNLPAAAGLGRMDEVRRLLPKADAEARHKAMALAALHGQVEVVRLLLDAGEDPSRYNPDGNHAHSTPLHQAVLAGHEAVVRLLVDRGARLDLKDTIHQGTPLGWAIHGGQKEIERFLRSRGAKPSDELGSHCDNPLARHGHVSYLQIPAIDPNKSAAFYGAVFGWQTRVNDAGRVSFDDPAGNLIGRWDTGLAAAREPGLLVFIYVVGIDAAVRRVVAQGCEVVKPPAPEGDVWISTVRDPAGNLIGLWQFDPR